MLDLTVIALTFGPVFIVELPDKTFVATLVLSTRYRPLLVWVGAGFAFGLQSALAVAAGSFAGLLPTWVVQVAAAVVFGAGAVVLFRAASRAEEAESQEEAEYAAQALVVGSGWKAVGASFVVLVTAELGDLSQLLTASRAAELGSPVSVFLGAWAALLAVSGIAVLVGRSMLRWVRLSLLHYIGSAVCLAVAAYTTFQLLT